VALLRAIVEKVRSEPDYFMLDLERAMIAAIEEVIPRADTVICSFHWKQCILREVSLKGLKTLMNNNDNFDTLVSLIYVLPYVPPRDLLTVWRVVIMAEYNAWKEQYPPAVKNYLDYIQRTYVGTKTRGPAFAHNAWSLYDRVLNDSKLTNNDIESFNSAFNGSSTKRPNVWQTVKAFQREETLADQRVLELRRHELTVEHRGRAQRLKEKQACIKEIVQSYNPDYIEDYFKALFQKV